jgi:hypothetical protein
MEGIMARVTSAGGIFFNAMLAQLGEHGVEILGRNDDDPAGRAAWFLDPANMKIELWDLKK